MSGTLALVTGATGFLGGHLAGFLQRKGWKVRALARETSDVSKLAALGVEIVYGDVTDTRSLVRAAQGVRVVFHSAAKVSDWAPRAEFLRVNHGGTRNVAEACRATGVERLVHVSSLTVLGLPRDGKRVDESTPYDSDALDPYTQSKVAAERVVRDAHGRGGVATVIVRPGVIWGPGDVTIVPRIVQLLRQRRMLYIDGARNVLGMSHAENLSHGLALAGEAPGARGEILHVTDGEEITGRQAIDALAEAMGTPKPSLSLPFPAVFAIATAMEGAARLAGRKTPPSLTRYGVRLVACDCRYDLSKARRVLGYEPVLTFREGIAQLASLEKAA